MADATLMVRAASEPEQGLRCGICQTPIQAGEAIGACPACAAPFHGECWEENGGCAVYGCARAPASVAPPAPPPVSHWGDEDKPCPGCGARIRAAARRCRHCGRVLSGESPRAPGGEAGAGGQRLAVVLLVAALVPLTSPLALLVGGPWLLLGWRRVRRWPATYRLAAVLAVVASVAVTAMLIVGMLVYLGRSAGPAE